MFTFFVGLLLGLVLGYLLRCVNLDVLERRVMALEIRTGIEKVE